ncbi:MAG: DUF4403 family protein [Geobacter sp.]|nr:MAG: DUF4403 family protein [Geobacter sp.]
MFVKRAVSLVGLVTVAATLLSCSSVNSAVEPLTAERPKEAAFRTELKREMSSLNVPIEASAEMLAKTLNQMIGKELYRGSTKYSGVTADVLRNGPIVVTAADNYVYLTLPISMSLRYTFFQTPAISSKLKFKLNAKVTPDWKINAEIYYVGLSDLFADETSIGPLTIKPRTVIEGITQPVQRVISDIISKKINEAFPVKAQVTKAWNAAQKPVLLDKRYNAWLQITPHEVMLYPLYTQNNAVKLNVGIKSFAEVVVGPEPAARPPVALPNLKLVSSLDKNFRIALNADLFYRDILNIISPLLLNKDVGSDGKSIILRDLDVYGNGDKLVIKVQTSGSVEGIFYLTGRPGFNPQTNMFSVEDVDFDMSSRSLLLQSANWFLHGTIRNTIQEKLNLDLTQRLEHSRDMAGKAMAQVQLRVNIFLKGSLKSMQISDVMVQKDRISIQLSSEGETVVVFQ